MQNLQQFVESLSPEPHFQWAWPEYKPSLVKLAKTFNVRHALEIGGGRFPTFNAEESQQYFTSYTSNDISEAELAKAPEHVKTICFDIAGREIPDKRYDLIFSKMVFEHIKDARQAYQNTYDLLNEDGVAVHFFPTLYAPPFVINYLLPEELSRRLLRLFFPDRNDDDVPKFPAYYDWCKSTLKQQKKIKEIGFSDVTLLPFYGHAYFHKIPLIKQLDAAFSGYAQKKDMRVFSTYCYAILRK